MEYNLDWNQYSWRTFEEICFEYVKNVYSTKFYKIELTQAKKDSGRDIIIKDYAGNFEAWGECKKHKRNIDLSVIGKNVILALSHQINKAIFFSVTSITSNTKIEILNVAQRSGFDVLFLDGDNLNIEILGCEKVAIKYFRKEYEKYVKNNKNNVWIDTLVSEFPFAEDAKNNAKKQYHLRNSFQIFLHIFVKNMRIEDISNVSVKLINIPDNDLIFYETDHKWNENLKAHTDLLHTFRGMVFSRKNNIDMPQLVINYSLSNGEFCQESINVGIIDASDIWKVPYVNSDSANFLATVTKTLQEIIPENYARAIFLYGKSGMGKSRLMSEIENKAYENSYRVIHIDFRENNEISAMQSFIMALLGIPFSKSKISLKYSQFEKIYADKYKSNDIKLLYEFLFSYNDEIVPLGLANTIINLLIEETNEEKILLGIDNVQEISRNLQSIFVTVLEHCKRISIPVCFVFSQNIERNKNNKNILIKYLNLLCEDQENFVIPQYCDILKEEDAIILMQELLQLSTESEYFIRTLLKRIELCPMDILLLAKSLEQVPGLFQTVKNRKYITNTNAFSLNEYEIPNTFDKVVNLRISNLSNKINDYKQLFSLLCFFEGVLKMEIFEKCSFSMDMLSVANQNIIIKVNPIENTIHFYHEKVYQYVKKQYVGLSTNIIDVIFAFYNEKVSKNFSEYYFFIKILIAKGKKEYAIKLGLELLEQYKNSIQSNYIIKLCNLLEKIIDSNKNPKDYFTTIFIKADFLLERINISEAENLFEKAKEIMINQYFLFDSQVITHFFHRYINQKLHTLQYEKALDAIEELEKYADTTTLSSMIIKDRLCVALYSLGKEKEALEAIENVIQTAKAENDTVWLSIAYSDKAFCNYYNSKNVDEIYLNFSKAIYYYEYGTEYNDISRKIEIQMQKTIINILTKNFKDARAEIQQSIVTAEEANYNYLLIPSYNLCSYLMIINNQIDSAHNLLKKALKYANAFSNPKALISIYNNLGSMYIVMEEYDEAYSRYLAGLKILKKICKPQNSFRYMGLLCNIVKLSIFINKTQNLSQIIEDYDFEILKSYTKKCKNAIFQNKNFNTFSNGILSFLGYEYLY